MGFAAVLVQHRRMTSFECIPALALSNAITNISASAFGEQLRLELIFEK